MPLLFAYDGLVIAFGLGVWGSSGRKRPLSVVAGLLVGYGVTGLVGPFAPMHHRGVGGTLTDTMHVVVTMVLVLFIVLIIGFGAAAFGKRFRLFSIGTILALVAFGALAGFDGSRLAANLPTPWLGVKERINIGGFLLWVVVLAITLLRFRDTAAVTGRPGPLAARLNRFRSPCFVSRCRSGCDARDARTHGHFAALGFSEHEADHEAQVVRESAPDDPPRGCACHPLSRRGHVAGVPRLRLVSMVARASKRLPAAFFSGPR